jgi:hypothetical protein
MRQDDVTPRHCVGRDAMTRTLQFTEKATQLKDKWRQGLSLFYHAHLPYSMTVYYFEHGGGKNLAKTANSMTVLALGVYFSALAVSCCSNK